MPKAEKDAGRSNKRGKNWTAADSLKLIDAYQHTQETKLGNAPSPPSIESFI
jgi:hypothetical protein